MPKPRYMSAALIIAAVTFSLAGSAPAPAQVTGSDVHSSQFAILAAGSRAARVAAITDVPSVGVVNLAFRTTPRFRDSNVPDVSEYRLSAEKNAAGVKRLQRALRANPVTRAALAERGIKISQVVGAQIGSRGALRLYILR